MKVGHADRYALGECIRRTGSRTMHLAFDSHLSREVVVKTFHADDDPACRPVREAALLADIRAAARLSHPNIVTVHDAGLCERGVFIVTELILGRDLRSRLADGWRPEPLQVARIAARIAQALSHAHGAGVVHGRVEPANVFMTGRTRLKVLNFGVAGAIAGLEAMPSELSGGALAFDQAGYLAPERLLGEPIHTRGDVYGLGLLMYEMLTGRPAFSGDSPSDLRRAILQADVPAVHALSPAVPVALSTIVTCAMARNPALRFPSAEHMLNALRVYLADAAGAAPQASRALVGMQRAVAILSMIAASALGVVALRSIPTDTPRPAQAQASAPVARASSPAASAAAPAAPVASSVASAASAVEPMAPSVASQSASEPVIAAKDIAAPLAASAAASGAASTAASAGTAERPAQRAATKPPKARPPVKTARKLELEQSNVGAGKVPAPSAATPPTLPTTTPPPTAPTAAAASGAAPRTGRGTIILAVEPRGQVEVNGVPIGATPPMLRLTLPNGAYTITVRNEGFPAYSTGVVVSDDKPVTINHRFGP